MDSSWRGVAAPVQAHVRRRPRAGLRGDGYHRWSPAGDHRGRPLLAGRRLPVRGGWGDESLSQAYENLKVFLAGVLADIAEESSNFGEFEKQLQFFAKHPGDRRALEAWERAVQKVRAGGANVPDIKCRDSTGWTPSVIAVDISSETSETIPLPALVANAPLRGELAA